MITQLQRIKAARRIAVGLLFVFMAIAPMLAFAQGSLGADGQNGKDKPFTIKNADELAYFAKLVNSGATTVKLNGSEKMASIKAGFENYHIKLTDDIDLNKQNWTPIGKDTYFRGHFDGDGHVVTGLKIDINDDSGNSVNAGLFGNVSGGEIRNLGVRLAKDGIKVESTNNVKVGGIVGYTINATTIRNCYVDAEKGGKIIIKAPSVFLGGIAGEFGSSGTITHCYSMVDIEAESVTEELIVNYFLSIGGIVGSNTGTISHCYATGSMIGQGQGQGQVFLSIGGICGDNSKNSGNPIQNNLALNKELRGETNNGTCSVNRIVGQDGNSVSNNYANPQMTLSSIPESGTTTNNEAGIDTWLDHFDGHLTGITGSEWGTAWEWTDGLLPQLKKVTDDIDNIFGDLIDGQTDHPASDYLPHSPWEDNVADAIENKDGNDGLSPAYPIMINTAGELAYFAQKVNSRDGSGIELKNYESKTYSSGVHTINHNDNNGEGFSAYYFALSADIDLQAGEWTPIGNSLQTPFRGHFDGKGHVVKGLKIKMDVKGGTDRDWTLAGLFGYVMNGTLQNIGVELADEGIEVSAEKGHVFAGGIAGRIDGSGDGGTAILRHCYVTGGKDAKIEITEAEKDAFAGGITGWGLHLTLTHCYATVDVEANANGTSYAGGIAGNSDNESYCYATGNVKANSSGGICGASTVSNCLALNQQIEGHDNWTYRITRYSYTSNYASSLTKINSSTITSPDPNSPNGADTWLDTFKDDLLKAPEGDGWSDGNGWVWPTESSSTLLPKLMMVDANGTYSSWPTRLDQPDVKVQPDIDAADYLDGRKTLHIVQPKEGTLTVSYDAPNAPAFKDGDLVVVGSTLKLLYTPPTTADYSLDKYLYGTSADRINQEINGDTYVMPNKNIWISASVNEPSKPDTDPDPVYPPPTPIYYTVTLPQVEGATTDPGAGYHEVESWNTFRFYLTLDPDYSDSQPIVTTSRGETLTPRESDGAYLVKYVRTDVEVRIDSIRPNLPPVANEAIASPAAQPRIWTEASTLCIGMPPTAPASTPVYVLTADGRLWRTLSAAPGLNRQTLPRGFYIIRVDDVTRKVIVR